MSTVKLYKKPAKRPEPALQPPPVTDEIDPCRADLCTVELSELVYNVVRSGVFKAQNENIPPWAPFNASLSQPLDLNVTTVAFNPIIMAPPTDYSTVYTTLLRQKEVNSALGFQYAPVFFDMGLLTKALEITWARPEELSDVFPCEGGMHLLMSFFSGIGLLYGDAGLKHLLYESGVFAEGTVNNMLTAGKDFDRTLRGLHFIDEVLNKRFLHQFNLWCMAEEKRLPDDLEKCISDINEAFDHDREQLQEKILQLQGIIETSLVPLLKQFRTEGRQSSPTFAVWDDFLQEVMLPFKMFMTASKTGNWVASQAAKAKILPFLFVSRRSTYAKYMSVQLLQMKRLPLELKESFDDGLFVAKLAEGRFNAVWADYALEVTENKALKGSGGIIGLTLRGNALARYFLSRPVMARYSQVFHQEYCQSKKTQDSAQHHSDKPAEKRKWDSSIEKMDRMFEEAYLDPFDLNKAPAQLVNFATGAVARSDIQNSMLNYIKTGKEMAKKFVSERLTERRAKSFHDTMPRTKCLTMSDMKVSTKVKNKSMSFDNSVMYRRLMAINRKYHSNVLCHLRMQVFP